MELIRAEHLKKEYIVGNNVVKALDDVSFSIEEGEFVIVVGASGAGKSTLLNILGGMDTPTGGKLYLEKTNVADFKRKELALYRRKDIGFVFQFYNLIGSLTALENVMLAASIADNPLDPKEIIKMVQLEKRQNNFPSGLSGGEQQRVAIARAVVKNPRLLLCDEPTGALDSKTGVTILSLLKEISVKEKKTVIIVTHNALFTEIADRVIRIQDGKIIENYKNEHPKKMDEIQW